LPETCDKCGSLCVGDALKWDIGYGQCDSYEKEKSNHGFCHADCDSNGDCAVDVCKECGSCKSKCVGDAANWNAERGTCDTYKAGLENHAYCTKDVDSKGKSAADVCKECGSCIEA